LRGRSIPHDYGIGVSLLSRKEKILAIGQEFVMPKLLKGEIRDLVPVQNRLRFSGKQALDPRDGYHRI
jgi:hypothetical protein